MVSMLDTGSCSPVSSILSTWKRGGERERDGEEGGEGKNTH